MVNKALKKGKNDILHIYLGYINETYNKRVISIIDDINGDPSKIYFCESYISSKIMRDLSKKPVLKVTTKLGRVNIDLWGLSTNISLERNQFI